MTNHAAAAANSAEQQAPRKSPAIASCDVAHYLRQDVLSAYHAACRHAGVVQCIASQHVGLQNWRLTTCILLCWPPFCLQGNRHIFEFSAVVEQPRVLRPPGKTQGPYPQQCRKRECSGRHRLLRYGHMLLVMQKVPAAPAQPSVCSLHRGITACL
jgi:hypothetical protein